MLQKVFKLCGPPEFCLMRRQCASLSISSAGTYSETALEKQETIKEGKSLFMIIAYTYLLLITAWRAQKDYEETHNYFFFDDDNESLMG